MHRREFLVVSEWRRSTVPGSADRRRTATGSNEIGALITAKMAEYHVPGVAFGIVKDGHVEMRGFGVTNVDNPQPVTPETVFPDRVDHQDGGRHRHHAARAGRPHRRHRARAALLARLQREGRSGGRIR